jgi:hypothetical protein
MNVGHIPQLAKGELGPQARAICQANGEDYRASVFLLDFQIRA